MKKKIEFIKELYRKPYGKAVFFFGFYLVFFIAIFIMLNVGGNKTETTNTEPVTGLDISNISSFNYLYEYQVVLDGNSYSYIGDKDNSTFRYTYNNKEYYTSKDKSYVKEDGWKEVENPIKFSSFFDETIMNKITSASYVDSKTSYNGGEVIYNLLVSSNTLNKILNGTETDIDEVPNKIKISLNNSRYISEINYDLNSYCKNSDSCNSLNITIKYKEFSKIS